MFANTAEATRSLARSIFNSDEWLRGCAALPCDWERNLCNASPLRALSSITLFLFLHCHQRRGNLSAFIFFSGRHRCAHNMDIYNASLHEGWMRGGCALMTKQCLSGSHMIMNDISFHPFVLFALVADTSSSIKSGCWSEPWKYVFRIPVIILRFTWRINMG